MSFNVSSLSSSSIVLGLSVVLTSIYLIRTIKYHATHKLPPGPKGIPFFGNLFQLSETPWKEFEIWKKQYGKSTDNPFPTLRTRINRWTTDSLMYITAAGTGMLVLNSHKAANDLLERRGLIYCDRPRFISKY